jgi:arylsulfatase A-like enzyme
VHVRDPDSAGHAAGWLSAAYYDAVMVADNAIGAIVDAARADAVRPTYILLTADHGGDGLNHFLNIAENRQIPWIVAGPDIAAGLTLSESVSIVDAMPTVLWLLGVDVPVGLSGRARTSLKKSASETGVEMPAPVAPVGFPCLLFAAPAGGLALWFARALLRIGANGGRRNVGNDKR